MRSSSSSSWRGGRRRMEDYYSGGGGGSDDDDSQDNDGFTYDSVFQFFANMTDGNVNDFDSSHLVAAEDVPVSAVLSSLVFNSIAFLLLMAAYECLRRLLPTVYSSRKRLDRIHAPTDSNSNFTEDDRYHPPPHVVPPPTDEIGVEEAIDDDVDERAAADVTAAARFGDGGGGAGDARCSNRTGSGGGDDNDNDNANRQRSGSPTTGYRAFPFNPDGNFGIARKNELRQSGLLPLPDDKPLDWIGPVFGVPWKKVRKIAGLDGYFFLRYIRMNVRITAVSTFWFFVVLVPIYATGGGPHANSQYHQYEDYYRQQNNYDENGEEPAYEDYLAATSSTATGWYYFSAANLPAHGWRIWVPCIFCYFFSAFIVFVIKQEYRHFLEIRQDFLARGTAHVNPQHHYSIMIESVPYELRSDRALKEYFEKMFPGKVHSASVVMKLPDLEELSSRCLRTCRRLEKSIAYLHATGSRPTHIVGRGRLSMLGVDMAPCDCNCVGDQADVVYIEDGRYVERPVRGTRVDSISYYTQELAADSRALFKMQQRKVQIADSGNLSFKADNWLNQVVIGFSTAADAILDDSLLNNDLLPSEDTNELFDTLSPRSLVESMTSQYGSFPSLSPNNENQTNTTIGFDEQDAQTNRGVQRMPACPEDREYKTPFARDQYKSRLRRWAGQLGLDFVVAVIRTMNRQLDVALEGVIGATMSSTGFVTFLDLSSTTCAASAPLTVKATALDANVAPEPREIKWNNVHVSKETLSSRELIANMVLVIGGIFWSFPLAAIQAFAKARYLAQIPGMEWIETFHGGIVSSFVNGYLPVLALLGLLLILPVLFEYIATHYEHRKTSSDIQASMVGRYFYYQLVTIYVTVTAGSLLKSLANIIDHPSAIFELLGESLPSMAGYFVALLVTKIMAGLPMIFLRFGALSRMLFLRCMSSEPKLTQRELDSVYRLENVQYGWEIPTQLLVVVIVFTYAVICPAILPVGLIYFIGALIVYKKQVLYVYSPVYESGGRFFPLAVQRTLFGLVCSQITLMGYLMTRGCRYQPIFLAPLPMMTIWAMGYFHRNYAEPSKRLSLERAREYDRISAWKEGRNNNSGSAAPPPSSAANNNNDSRTPPPFPSRDSIMNETEESEKAALENRRRQFDKSAYQQPVLTELATEPMTYRRGVYDPETAQVRAQLRRVNRYVSPVAPEPGPLGFQSPVI